VEAAEHVSLAANTFVRFAIKDDYLGSGSKNYKRFFEARRLEVEANLMGELTHNKDKNNLNLIKAAAVNKEIWDTIEVFFLYYKEKKDKRKNIIEKVIACEEYLLKERGQPIKPEMVVIRWYESLVFFHDWLITYFEHGITGVVCPLENATITKPSEL
jgi:hypothetical protein